jgi:hypothetical protein
MEEKKMAEKKISELPQVTDMAVDDKILVEKSAGTKIIRYEDLLADLERKIQTDIKRAATYQGRNLTDVYTPAQLSAKIKKQDFIDLNIGDYFDVTLKNSEEVQFVISGFNTNLMQGNNGVGINTNPHITMTFRDCLKTTYQMNSSNTNTGGYAGSKLAETVNTTIYNLLPDAWESIVMPTSRLEPNKGTIAWATRNMWLLSEPEVLGRSCRGESEYGCGVMQLPIFAGSFRHIIKGLGKGASEGGSKFNWWLASPYASNTTCFSGISSDGYANYYNASYKYGVAPGFNIY